MMFRVEIVSMIILQVTTSYMKMISSYVMQDDQLFPMLTVFETFMFAAEVRLPPSISRAEKKKRVEELLDQLGLTVLILVSHSRLCFLSLHGQTMNELLFNCRVQLIHTSVMRGGGAYQEENEGGCL